MVVLLTSISLHFNIYSDINRQTERNIYTFPW